MGQRAGGSGHRSAERLRLANASSAASLATPSECCRNDNARAQKRNQSEPLQNFT